MIKIKLNYDKIKLKYAVAVISRCTKTCIEDYFSTSDDDGFIPN